MKTRWYRKSGIKGLLVLLTVFFMVAACAGAGVSVMIMNTGVQPLDSKDYVDSQSFTDNVYNLSHTIVDAINERHILDQADDEELIDLKELNRGDTLTHKSTSGLAYRAGDLYDWAKSSSWDTSTNVLICRQPDGSDYYMYYRDFADKIATGELKFVFGSDEDEGTENTKDILSMLSGREYTYYGYESDNIGIRNNGVEYVTDADGNVVYTDVYNYESSGNNDAPLKEVYKPDGADSILDVVNNNKEWKGNLNKAYQYLYEALVQYSDASYGEKILKTYASGATNVNYMYVDTKSGKVYTNIKDVTSSNYLKTLDKLTSGAGPFMLIAPDIQDCVLGFSNISDWTVSYWQNMLENTGLAGENYLYFVSVDKDFPVLDRIKQEKLVYDKFEPWLVPVMAGSVLALILALAGVVLMTIGAGRNNEDKKVHLNFFDRCYTEIVAVVVFMIWLMGTSVIVQAMDDEEMRMVWKAIGFGTLGLWFGIWFLAGWLSLVRRIKARSLWRDSLLRHILLLVRKCFSKCSDLLVFLEAVCLIHIFDSSFHSFFHFIPEFAFFAFADNSYSGTFFNRKVIVDLRDEWTLFLFCFLGFRGFLGICYKRCNKLLCFFFLASCQQGYRSQQGYRRYCSSSHFNLLFLAGYCSSSSALSVYSNLYFTKLLHLVTRFLHYTLFRFSVQSFYSFFTKSRNAVPCGSVSNFIIFPVFGCLNSRPQEHKPREVPFSPEGLYFRSPRRGIPACESCTRIW